MLFFVFVFVCFLFSTKGFFCCSCATILSPLATSGLYISKIYIIYTYIKSASLLSFSVFLIFQSGDQLTRDQLVHLLQSLAEKLVRLVSNRKKRKVIAWSLELFNCVREELINLS